MPQRKICILGEVNVQHFFKAGSRETITILFKNFFSCIVFREELIDLQASWVDFDMCTYFSLHKIQNLEYEMPIFIELILITFSSCVFLRMVLS